MNRRGFLGAILALGAAALAPAWTWAERKGFIRARFITRAVILNENWMAGVEPCYVAFVHTSVERDLRNLLARERWKYAWRRYRVARRKGIGCELPPILVLAVFGDPPLPVPEIGTFEGARIVSQAVPA